MESPSPSSAHRRIELQTPSDLTYLVNNVSHAARAKIDLHLPPGAAPEAGEDDMRRRVEVLVQEYIDKVFKAAKSSVTVNGIPGIEVQGLGEGRAEEFEPYDTRLAGRITALSATVESLNLQLANMRRTAPMLAAEQFRDRFATESQEFDAGIEQQEDAARANGQELGRLALDNDLGIKRAEALQTTYHRGTEGLDRLRSGLGESRAKAERATEAVTYLAGR